MTACRHRGTLDSPHVKSGPEGRRRFAQRVSLRAGDRGPRCDVLTCTANGSSPSAVVRHWSTGWRRLPLGRPGSHDPSGEGGCLCGEDSGDLADRLGECVDHLGHLLLVFRGEGGVQPEPVPGPVVVQHPVDVGEAGVEGLPENGVPGVEDRAQRRDRGP